MVTPPCPAYERPVRRRRRLLGPGLPEPEDPGRRGLPRPNRKFLYVLLAALIVSAVVRAFVGQHGSKPPLAASCTTPGMVIEHDQVQLASQVLLYVTGPKTAVYAAYLDVTALTVVDGQVTATTRAGVAKDLTEKLFPAGSVPAAPLSGHCTAVVSTTLTAAVPAGQHEITLFRIAADGSGTPLVTRPLTVTHF